MRRNGRIEVPRDPVARYPGHQARTGPSGWHRCDHPDVVWLGARAPQVIELDEVANWPQCDRWWPSMRLLAHCTHGLDIVPDTTGGASVTQTLTPNQYAGDCFRCGQVVAAQTGRLVICNGRARPQHRRREDCYDHSMR